MYIHSRAGDEESCSFLRAVRVASLEPLEILQGVPGQEEASCLTHLLQVTNCQLENVSLLQLRHVLTFSLQCHCHYILEFIQASIYPGAPLSFKKWFCDLFISLF